MKPQWRLNQPIKYKERIENKICTLCRNKNDREQTYCSTCKVIRKRKRDAQQRISRFNAAINCNS